MADMPFRGDVSLEEWADDRRRAAGEAAHAPISGQGAQYNPKAEQAGLVLSITSKWVVGMLIAGAGLIFVLAIVWAIQNLVAIIGALILIALFLAAL